MLHLSADDLAALYAVDAVHEFPFLVLDRPERYEEMLCEAEMSRRKKALRAGRKIPAASLRASTVAWELMRVARWADD